MTRLDVAIVAVAAGFAAGVWGTNAHVASPTDAPNVAKVSQVHTDTCTTDNLFCWVDKAFPPKYDVPLEEQLKLQLEDPNAEVR